MKKNIVLEYIDSVIYHRRTTLDIDRDWFDKYKKEFQDEYLRGLELSDYDFVNDYGIKIMEAWESETGPFDMKIVDAESGEYWSLDIIED